MRPEVLRRVLGGGGVDAGRAVLLGDLGKLVGNDVLLRGIDGVIEGLLQCGELRRILADALAELGVVGGVGLLHLGERDLLGSVVGGADLGRCP